MILYPGSTTPIDRLFANDEDAVTVVAKDYNGLVIPTTDAAPTGSGVWRTTLSIPATAPACGPEDYYKLVWTHSGGTIEQEFQVVAYDEETHRPSPAGFGVANVSLSDEVFLPYGVTDVECEILNVTDGSVLLPHVNGQVTTENVGTGSVHATVDFVAPLLGVGEYVAHWRYKVGASVHHDFRQAFIISTKTASILSNLRMFLDQSGITRFLATYSFSDVELVDCLYRAADRINAEPPQVTAFTPDSMPFGLIEAQRRAALHEMLNRLYLAEGLATFDFQGGSISVNVERTQYIQTKMDEMGSWLDSKLTAIKSVNLAGRSIGILHVSVSQGGLNNNFRARGRLLNPQAFNLARQMGFNFA